MNQTAVLHRMDSEYAYPVSKNSMAVALRTARDDIDRVIIHYHDMFKDRLGTRERLEAPLTEKKSAGLFDWHRTEINTTGLGSIFYWFELVHGDKRTFYAGDNFYEQPVEDVGMMYVMPYICTADIPVVPEWSYDAIVYQVFPDRFCNTDSSLDPPGTKPWNYEVDHLQFLGGDLDGIRSKLEYLLDLGINTVYLTPIFQALRPHKYDTNDYYRLDPQFGSEESLRLLIEEAHASGIRIIFDAVFNHTGQGFFAFQDLLQNQEKSKYRDWFDVYSFPVDTDGDLPNFASYSYRKTMPKLQTANPEVSRYLVDVAVYWIREFDIDGWRIDVADQIDHRFWRDLRSAVKDVKEEALLIGEVWKEATPWCEGDQFDSVMNYPFCFAIHDFIKHRNIDATEFADRLSRIAVVYKRPAYHALWNLVSSHDLSRFIDSDDSIAHLKLAVTIQMSLPGVPMIYYGDEVGMRGEGKFNRLGMIWDPDRQDRELLAWYKRCIAMRKESEVLRKGSMEVVSVDPDNNTLVLERAYQNQRARIYINNGIIPVEYYLDENEARDILNGRPLKREKPLDVDPGEAVVVAWNI
jgi:cyclomaltodextrinase